MTALVSAHRLYVLSSVLFLGIGCFVLIHPELERGASLILLGLAALERGSRRARRLFNLGVLPSPREGYPTVPWPLF